MSRRRKHSKIDALDPALKQAVEQMLLDGSTYADIVAFLADNGVGLSTASVCRYAQAYNANLQMLQVAQENFRRMMDEVERYPDLDMTEVIARIVSQRLLDALMAAPDEAWQSADINKLITEANGLIRAVAHKRRSDAQNQQAEEAGLDAVKSLVFATMAKERPDLYNQVAQYLRDKKQDGMEG